MKEIPLTQGKVALVDDEDFPELSKHRWYAQKIHNVFYAARTVSGTRKCLYMHRAILNPEKGKMCDHINGDGLDNRKTNLRVVTNRENLQNLHSPKTSKYPGVHSSRRKKHPWASNIQINGKIKRLGVFRTEEEAHIAYQNECDKLLSGRNFV